MISTYPTDNHKQLLKDEHIIKGFAITPPILGRISISKIMEKNGKRLPEKDNQFTITNQIQNKDSGWMKHPLDEQLRVKAPNQKIRTIQVRMIFNDPELNLRAGYTYVTARQADVLCRQGRNLSAVD